MWGGWDLLERAGSFATVTVRNVLSLPLVLSMVLTTPCFKLQTTSRKIQSETEKHCVAKSSPVAFCFTRLCAARVRAPRVEPPRCADKEGAGFFFSLPPFFFVIDLLG